MPRADGRADPGLPAPDLRWSSWVEAALLIAGGRTLLSVWWTAAVVGTLLTGTYRGTAPLSGDVDALTAGRVVANYVIPDTDSSQGLLRAWRTRSGADALPGPGRRSAHEPG